MTDVTATARAAVPPPPSGIRVFATHVRYRILEFARTPFAIWPTLVFPVMIAAFFVVPNVGDVPEAATYSTVTITLFAFTMIAMFTFGAGEAEERRLAWSGFVRALPVHPAAPLGARVVVGLVFAVVGAAPAVALCMATTPVSVAPSQWPLLAAAVLAGAVAMALLGLTLGNALPPKAAIATANVVFLPMAFIGGLLIPVDALPRWADLVGMATPVRPWVEVATGTALGSDVALGWWAAVAGWIVVLGASAGWAYRRDAVQRFS